MYTGSIIHKGAAILLSQTAKTGLSYFDVWSNRVHPDNKVDEANMGPTWGRQDPGGPHVGTMNFAIWAFTR